MSEPEDYVGRDNLAAMRAAPRYNRAILGHVLRNGCGSRMLDFGAGDGLFAELVAERRPAPECVETDRELSAHLAARGFAVHRSLDSVHGEFDAIYSINVLEHIEDDLDTLRRLCQLTSAGGRLVLFVPAWPILYSSMDRKVGHVRRYRKRELLAKLVAANWVVTRVRFFDSLGFFSALAYRFFGSSSGELSSRTLAFYDTWIFPASLLLDRVLSGFVGKNLLVEARRR
jgi:SAM-dependent methyltransferase